MLLCIFCSIEGGLKLQCFPSSSQIILIPLLNLQCKFIFLIRKFQLCCVVVFTIFLSWNLHSLYLYILGRLSSSHQQLFYNLEQLYYNYRRKSINTLKFIHISYLKTKVKNNEYFIQMSSRKSSIRIDRTQDLIDFRNRNIDLPRQRKSSIASNRATLQQLHSTINITLDQKLTTKLMFVKKLQKLQKEAIKYFYDQKSQQCYQCLQKCLNLLEQKSYPGQVNTDENYFPEHLIYVRYLQCQFKFKQKLYQESREYYDKVSKIIPKLNKNEKEKTKEYLSSLEVLNACLLFEQGKFAQSIKYIEQFQEKIKQGRYKINQKTFKQVSMCKIQSLMQLNQFKIVIKLVENFTKQDLSFNVRQKWKMNSMLALAFKKVGQIEKSQQIMQKLIENLKKQTNKYEQNYLGNSDEILNELKCYISKFYASYVDLFVEQPIKAIFIAKKWSSQCQQSDHAKAKLFHLFYQIGDYEQALLQFSQISQNYKRTSEDWQYLAQIKYFYGQTDTAQHMYNKALQLSKGQQSKMMLQLKLLYFSTQENRKQSMKNFQRKIKDNRSRNWINKIVQKYGQFLSTISEDSRLQKINKIIGFENKNTAQFNNSPLNSINQLMQTGKFGSVTLNKQDTFKNVNPRKRNSLMIPRML